MGVEMLFNKDICKLVSPISAGISNEAANAEIEFVLLKLKEYVSLVVPPGPAMPDKKLVLPALRVPKELSVAFASSGADKNNPNEAIANHFPARLNI